MAMDTEKKNKVDFHLRRNTMVSDDTIIPRQVVGTFDYKSSCNSLAERIVHHLTIGDAVRELVERGKNNKLF